VVVVVTAAGCDRDCFPWIVLDFIGSG